MIPPGGGTTAAFADTLSTLAGSVYVDLDNDGVRDTGEPGLSGISIQLTGTDAAAQAVNRTATTDSSGAFLFIDLLTPNGAGYTVREPVQPPAYMDGQDAAGTAGGTVGNDVVNAIHLGFNTDATGYTFGEHGTNITGVVCKDANANGTRDGGDIGIAGVIVTLKDAIGTVVATTTTAADGSYGFFGLPAASYQVEETQPAGYASSTPNLQPVTVPSGGTASVDFGETTSSIAGAVWSDTNNNGQRDAGEPGIGGVSVVLSGSDAAGVAVSRTVTTDATGNFVLADVLDGTYDADQRRNPLPTQTAWMLWVPLAARSAMTSSPRSRCLLARLRRGICSASFPSPSMDTCGSTRIATVRWKRRRRSPSSR